MRPEELDRIAEVAHNAYASSMAGQRGTPVKDLLPWDQVPEDNREALRAAVDEAIDAYVGYLVTTAWKGVLR